MATKTDITLKPAAGSPREQELDALATVYRFVLECRAKRKADKPAPEPAGRDDVREDLDAHTATKNHNSR